MRLYILFMGPADQDMEWTDTGIEGMSRFVRRLWRTVLEVAESAPADGPGDTALARKAHETIVRVSDDVDALPLQHADRRGDGAGERALEGRGALRTRALRPRPPCP